MTECGVCLENKGPTSMKGITTLSTAATPAQMSGEEREPFVPMGSEWKWAGWKMPLGWLSPQGHQNSLCEEICPGPGSSPVPRGGQKAISFLWIRPILNTFVPEFHVSPILGPEPFGTAHTLTTDMFSCPYSHTSLPAQHLIRVKGNLCKTDLLTPVPPNLNLCVLQRWQAPLRSPSHLSPPSPSPLQPPQEPRV